MKKSILFQWTGFAPKDAVVDHRLQVSCACVCPSKAAFMRLTDRKPSGMPWVNVHDITGKVSEDLGNEGARLAVASPGVVYWEDTLRHIPRDAPWLVHPDPERS